MFISNGTTFQENSKARLLGLISSMNGIDGELNEEEWVLNKKPNGIGLFEGTKDGLMYRSICLTEEFTYD